MSEFVNEDEWVEGGDELMPGEGDDDDDYDDDDVAPVEDNNGEKGSGRESAARDDNEAPPLPTQPDEAAATLEERLRAMRMQSLTEETDDDNDGGDDDGNSGGNGSGVHERAADALLHALLLPRAPSESDAMYAERADDAVRAALRMAAAAADSDVAPMHHHRVASSSASSSSQSEVRRRRRRERQFQAMIDLRAAVPQYVPRTETRAEFRERLNRETDYHAFDEVAPTSMASRCFLRPEYAEPTTNDEEITFMIMDMDTTNTLTNRWEVLARHGDDVRPNYWSFYVRLFGVTADGRSVACYVRGFAPYVYVEVPPHWVHRDCTRFIADLDRSSGGGRLRQFARNVTDYALVERVNIYGYTKETKVKMMRIAFGSASARRRFIEYIAGRTDFRDVVDPHTGETRREKTYTPGRRDAGLPQYRQHEFWLYDANVTPRMQFVNCTKILPSHWVTLRAGTYERHNAPMLEPHERRTRCQIDVDTDYDAVVVDAERADIAPFLVESWDIECVRGARDDEFPDATNSADEIIQIGSTVWRFGDDDYVHQSVHCVRPTANVDLATEWDVYSYRDERAMLDGYMRYSRDHVDADVRVAFNQYKFDNPYLDARNQRHFRYKGERSAYDKGEVEYGRVNGKVSASRAHFGGSRAHGGRTTHTIRAEGRIDLDVFKHAAEQWKLPRGLDYIASSLLGLHKDDIDYRQINSKYDEGAFERGEVARYCRVDTELPLRIIRKKKVLVEMIEQSRLCGVPLNDIFNKKMMARVFALVSREAHDAGYVLPEKPERFVKDPYLRQMMFGDMSPEGATVLPATRDFFDMPICTLDFASLYPSIMRGYGLCYTTLILDPAWLDDADTQPHCVEIRNPRNAEQPPFKVYWAKKNKRPLLYNVISKLLAARKAAKEAGAAATNAGDYFRASQYDAKQLALKIIANSVYGFTGAAVGPLPCVAITATVTWYGRSMIETTRTYVERNCPGSRVIYGDTDSVMIDFGVGNDEAAFRAAFDVGKRMAHEVTQLFPDEVKLEFEKVFMPYIQWKKKSYAGMLYTDPDKPGVYKKKGIASVRGDKIRFVKTLTDTLVNQMMEDKSTERARRTLESELRRLVDGHVPLADLVIEKKLAKETDMYGGPTQARTALKAKDKRKPEHVLVTEEMQRRCPGQAPTAGSIVSYVIAFDEQTQQKVPVDVAWFRANPRRFRVHTEHYLTNLIRETVGNLIHLPRFTSDPFRLFDPFIAETRARHMGCDLTAFVRKRPLVAPSAVANAGAVGAEHCASKLKRACLKKEDERRLKDEARTAGRDYKAYKAGSSIASFVQKRTGPAVAMPLAARLAATGARGGGGIRGGGGGGVGGYASGAAANSSVHRAPRTPHSATSTCEAGATSAAKRRRLSSAST